jgi:hypothetical protein
MTCPFCFRNRFGIKCPEGHLKAILFGALSPGKAGLPGKETTYSLKASLDPASKKGISGKSVPFNMKPLAGMRVSSMRNRSKFGIPVKPF